MATEHTVRRAEKFPQIIAGDASTAAAVKQERVVQRRTVHMLRHSTISISSSSSSNSYKDLLWSAYAMCVLVEALASFGHA
jgi:hypothetical protein